MNICPKCGEERERYRSDRRTCKPCFLAQSAFHARKRSPEKRRKEYQERRKRNPASIAWNSLQQRAGNRDGRHPAYAHVEVRMTREEFYEWYNARYFPGCSVDRIDSKGHYELANLQLVTHAENSSRKGRYLHAPDGTAWCSSHRDYTPLDQFTPDPRRRSGVASTCRECVRNRRKALKCRQ